MFNKLGQKWLLKKKKKNPYLPTLFLFSLLRQYNNFLFLALVWSYEVL